VCHKNNKNEYLIKINALLPVRPCGDLPQYEPECFAVEACFREAVASPAPIIYQGPEVFPIQGV
jgi:hypothetical protein